MEQKQEVQQNNELTQAITYLKDYVQSDRRMRSEEPQMWTDFDKYCETLCKAIETILDAIEKKGDKLEK